jgi:hypothetical protein
VIPTTLVLQCDCHTFRILCDVPSTAAFVLNILNVFLAWVPNISVTFCCHSGG